PAPLPAGDRPLPARRAKAARSGRRRQRSMLVAHRGGHAAWLSRSSTCTISRSISRSAARCSARDGPWSRPSTGSASRSTPRGRAGESGCGKTTTSKLVLAAEAPTSGTIEFEGRNVGQLRGPALQDYRRKVQVVFQDPYSSLSPRMRVGDIIAEPIRAHERLSSADVRARVVHLLQLVAFRPD